jgi:hypothetical protein
MKYFKVNCFESQFLCVMDIPGYSHMGPEKRSWFGTGFGRIYRPVFFEAKNASHLQRVLKEALESNPYADCDFDRFLQGFNVVTAYVSKCFLKRKTKH